MASLTIADDETGTTATATISGSGGGANVVYTQNVDGQLGSGTWTASGSRTGDGTVTLTLSKGYYWAYCLTNGSTISNLVYFKVSDGEEAVMARVFDAVKSHMQLLNLPFTQLVIDSQYEGYQALVKYPCTVLTTEDTRQSDEGALNGRDDVGNPVYCQIMIHCLKFDNSAKNTLRKYRQAVFRAFHNQQLPGVIESVMNKVEFGEIARVAGDAPAARSDLTIRCTTREVRGLGA